MKISLSNEISENRELLSDGNVTLANTYEENEVNDDISQEEFIANQHDTDFYTNPTIESILDSFKKLYLNEDIRNDLTKWQSLFAESKIYIDNDEEVFTFTYQLFYFLLCEETVRSRSVQLHIDIFVFLYDSLIPDEIESFLLENFNVTIVKDLIGKINSRKLDLRRKKLFSCKKNLHDIELEIFAEDVWRLNIIPYINRERGLVTDTMNFVFKEVLRNNDLTKEVLRNVAFEYFLKAFDDPGFSVTDEALDVILNFFMFGRKRKKILSVFSEIGYDERKINHTIDLILKASIRTKKLLNKDVDSALRFVKFSESFPMFVLFLACIGLSYFFKPGEWCTLVGFMGFIAYCILSDIKNSYYQFFAQVGVFSFALLFLWFFT